MKQSSKKYLFLLIFISQVSFIFSQQIPYKCSDELDLMRRVDLLPQYRTNALVEQISSYDRTGGNDDGFSGKYSYLRIENGKLVIADLKGPGVINRIWTATPTTDTISFYFDGETTPRIKLPFMDLFSGQVFPFQAPICGNAIGGYYSYFPIPYKESCKILFNGQKMEFIQIQYRNLPGYNVESYTGYFSSTERSLLLNVRNIWSNIFPNINNFTTNLSSGITTETKSVILNPGEENTFFETSTPGRIVGIEMDAGKSFEGLNKDVILSAVWDNEPVEAIYSPVADFFGYAYGKASMRGLLAGRSNTNNYAFFPMPFDQSAKLKLIYKQRQNAAQNPITVNIKIHYNNNPREQANEGKFYTSWNREINPPLGRFYKFLFHEGKGHYVGTMHIAQGLRPGVTLFFEGDDSTYVDGKMRIHGTGSEDYYNGGWYNIAGRWDRAYSLAVHGSLDYNAALYRTGGYRFFIGDKMSFENEIYHGMEHGPQGNEFPVDYTSVAYFYSSTPLTKRKEPTEFLREVYVPTDPFLRSDFKELNYNIRPQHGDIAVGDIDDDGDLDIVAIGQQRNTPFLVQGGIFINDGMGNFTYKSNLPFTLGYLATIDFGDIDGDGDLDIIYTGSNNESITFLNGIALNDGKGNFTFTDKLQFPTPSNNNRGGIFADFNNDGLLDYCLTGSGASSYTAIYLQQTDGSFIENKSSFIGYNFIDPIIQPVDYNNDGFTDLFVMGWLDTAKGTFPKGSFTALFKNDGKGNFDCISMPNVRMKSFGSADWGDLDGNGWLDFIQHGEGRGSSELNDWLHRVYKYDGVNFTPVFQYERSRQFSTGGADIIQDMDNDGKPDILFGGWCDRLIPSPRQKTFVYLNNDDDNDLMYEDFNEHYFLSNQYLPGMSEQDYEIADVDGDNKVDFIYMGFAENYPDNPVQTNRPILGWSPSPVDPSLRVYPFVQLEAPQNLNAVSTGTGSDRRVILSWDEPLNNSGRKNTTYNLAVKNTITGKWAYNPLAVIGGQKDGWRKINRMGNMFLNKKVELNLPVGEYQWTVQAVDAARFGGKFAPMQSLNVSTGLHHNEIYFTPKIRLLNNELTIDSDQNENLTISIYGMIGSKILETSFVNSFKTKLQNGVYIIHIRGNNKEYRTKLMVK